MNRENSNKKIEEFKKSSFVSMRDVREVSGKIESSKDVIFPLLCSVREADWLPGSSHKLVYSESNYAENYYIFQSDYFGFGLETWVRYDHKANESLSYIRCSENLVIKFSIDLEEISENLTNMKINLMFTSLTEEGNKMILGLPKELPLDSVLEALNYYIVHGEQIKK